MSISITQFYLSQMKCSIAEKMILWDKVDDNVEFVEKVAHQYLQNIHESPPKQMQQSQYNNHDTTSSEFNKSFKITKKMLVRNFKEEQEKASRLNNKLAYIRLSQYRQQKALELTKRNLIRLNDIRNRSLKQRQIMAKMRRTFDFQQQTAIQKKTRQIKSSRKNRQQALEKWKSVIKQTADFVRVEKGKFHTITNQQKHEMLQSKLRQVSNVKKSLQKSRLTIEQSNQSRIQTTRMRHRRQLETRYKKLNEQKMQNQKLLDIFRNETQKISQRQSRIKKQVELCKTIWAKCNENPEDTGILLLEQNHSFSHQKN